jgi:hypothetical protein
MLMVVQDRPAIVGLQALVKGLGSERFALPEPPLPRAFGFDRAQPTASATRTLLPHTVAFPMPHIPVPLRVLSASGEPRDTDGDDLMSVLDCPSDATGCGANP